MNPGPLTLRPLWSVLIGLVLLIAGQPGQPGSHEDRGVVLAPLRLAHALHVTGRCVSELAASERDRDPSETKRFELLQPALHTLSTFRPRAPTASKLLANPPPRLEIRRRVARHQALAPPA